MYQSDSGSDENNSKYQKQTLKKNSHVVITGSFNYKGTVLNDWVTPGLDENQKGIFIHQNFKT